MEGNKNKIILACALLAGAFLQAAAPVRAASLGQEQLADLIKPSVVRIAQHVTGSITVPAFDIDLETWEILPIPGQKNPPQPVDEYLTGSGFVISRDGYIATNSHVVSTATIKELSVEEAARQVLERKIGSMSDGDLEKLFPSESAAIEFAQKLLEFVEAEGVFDLESSVTVLKPTSAARELPALIADGFPAAVVSVNDNFLKDGKDVAVVKINQINTPAMALGSGTMSTGNHIYVFGFPATAEFNTVNPLESTFTEGLISAVKFSDNREFNIFQTDAKISQGSSGGPMFNGQGEAGGIITFETGELARQTGDNFAFAIPTNLLSPILSRLGIKDQEGLYSEHFKNGLQFFQQRSCKAALEEFSLARETNAFFGVDRYIKPYIEQCTQLITEGKSVDTPIQGIRAFINTMTGFTWFVVAGRIVLAVLAALAVFFLANRLIKDEKEIQVLHTELDQELEFSKKILLELKNRGVEVPLPDEETHSAARLMLAIPHPHVAHFVKEARIAGMPDPHIHTELKNAGWHDHEIKGAMEITNDKSDKNNKNDKNVAALNNK